MTIIRTILVILSVITLIAMILDANGDDDNPEKKPSIVLFLIFIALMSIIFLI